MASRRNFTYHYQFDKTRVCKGFYLATLNITDAVIVGMNKRVQSGRPITEDLRGKQRNALKHKEEDLNMIRQHIKLFPFMESHYIRKSSLYLASDLNITKMYELFNEKYPATKIKIHLYRKIFNTNFNYSFHTPKKDACSICERYNLNSETNDELRMLYNEHINNKELARQAKDTDKKKAISSFDSVRMYTFDLQSVLYTPCSNVSNFYYKRKFESYNLTLYDMASRDGYCYYWKQTDDAIFALQLTQKYHKLLSVTKAKKQDLVSLCIAGLIPIRHTNFYENLPIINSTDVLEEPNFDESDQE